MPEQWFCPGKDSPGNLIYPPCHFEAAALCRPKNLCMPATRRAIELERPFASTPPVIANAGAAIVKEPAIEWSEAISDDEEIRPSLCDAVLLKFFPGVETPGYLRMVATRPDLNGRAKRERAVTARAAGMTYPGMQNIFASVGEG
jgi:hypothetical protein